MRNFLARIFRACISPLVFRPATYLPGMVLVRLSRTCRKLFYSPGQKPEYAEVKLAGKMKMRIDRNSYMGGSIYWSGFHHLQELLYLQDRLKPGMCFIDVGANQGEFTLYAAYRVGPGSVLAFEPVTKIRERLMANLSLNHVNNTEVFSFGLSEKKGSFPIYTSLETDVHHGIHEGLSTLYPTAQRDTFEEQIQLDVFDSFFADRTIHPDLIKIDVEGAELSVLKGMQALLAAHKPELLLEINDETFVSAGYTTKALLAFLSNYQYKPYRIARGKLVLIDEDQLPSIGNIVFRA